MEYKFKQLKRSSRGRTVYSLLPYPVFTASAELEELLKCERVAVFTGFIYFFPFCGLVLLV